MPCGLTNNIDTSSDEGRGAVSPVAGRQFVERLQGSTNTCQDILRGYGVFDCWGVKCQTVNRFHGACNLYAMPLGFTQVLRRLTDSSR